MSRGRIARACVAAAAAVLLTVGATAALARFAGPGDPLTTWSAPPDIRLVGADDFPHDGLDFRPGFDDLVPGVEAIDKVFVLNLGGGPARLDLALPRITNSHGSPGEALEDLITLVILDMSTGAEMFAGPLTTASFTDLVVHAGESQVVPLKLLATLDESATSDVGGQTIDIVFTFTARHG